MTTLTVVLSKPQIVAALTQAALASVGVDPNTPGLTTNVRIVEELDVPAVRDYPRATVTVTTP